MQVQPSVNCAAGARLPLPERQDWLQRENRMKHRRRLWVRQDGFLCWGGAAACQSNGRNATLTIAYRRRTASAVRPQGAAWISCAGWMGVCDVNITVFLLLLHCNTAFSRTQEENVRFIHKNPRLLSCKMHKECVKKHTNTLDLCNLFADRWLIYPFRPICCVHRRNARNGHWLQGRCGKRNDRRLRLQSPVEKGKRLGNWREIIVRRFLPFCFRVRAVPSSSYRRSYPACRMRR